MGAAVLGEPHPTVRFRLCLGSPCEPFDDLTLVTELALSPAGDRVAFVADEFDPADPEPRPLVVSIHGGPVSYDAASSITDVGNVDTPLLVTAGGEDWRCPPSQSEQLYVSVKKQGVPAKLVVYPDEHHNVGDPDRAIHRLEQLEDWYATHDPGRE